MVDYILKKNAWNSLEDPGYGKGYEILKKEWVTFLKGLEFLNQNKKHVLCVNSKLNQ